MQTQCVAELIEKKNFNLKFKNVSVLMFNKNLCYE